MKFTFIDISLTSGKVTLWQVRMWIYFTGFLFFFFNDRGVSFGDNLMQIIAKLW